MDLLRSLSNFDLSCTELKELIETHFSVYSKKLEFFEQQIEDYRKCLIESKIYYTNMIKKLFEEKRDLQNAKETDWDTYSKNIDRLESLCHNIEMLGPNIDKDFDEKFQKFKSSLNSFFTKDDLLKGNDFTSKSTSATHSVDNILRSLQLKFPQFPDQNFKNIETKYTKCLMINKENRNNYLTSDDLNYFNNSFCVMSFEFSYKSSDNFKMPSNIINLFENYIMTSHSYPTKTIRIGGLLKNFENLCRIIVKDDFFISNMLHSIRVYKYYFEEDIISHCVVNRNTEYSNYDYFRKVEDKFKLLDAIRKFNSQLKKGLISV
jgi:hypothetical protein